MSNSKRIVYNKLRKMANEDLQNANFITMLLVYTVDMTQMS